MSLIVSSLAWLFNNAALWFIFGAELLVSVWRCLDALRHSKVGLIEIAHRTITRMCCNYRMVAYLRGLEGWWENQFAGGRGLLRGGWWCRQRCDPQGLRSETSANREADSGMIRSLWSTGPDVGVLFSSPCRRLPCDNWQAPERRQRPAVTGNGLVFIGGDR